MRDAQVLVVCVCVCLLGGLKVEKEVQSVKELSQVNNSSHASCSAAAARGVGTQFLRYMTTSKTIHSEDWDFLSHDPWESWRGMHR